jgi:glycosyltransferase involved in cell wall biosynthesis
MVDLGWVEPDRVHVVDLPLVGPVAPAPPADPGPVRFLFVGSLIPTKGPQVLVEAFAGLPETMADATLVLWGPAPVFDGVPDFARKLKRRIRQVPGIRHGGMFGTEARSTVYGDADVLVLPSTWEENSPLVAREAAAAGLRIVASRVGGLPELVPDARWVPPGDVDALREALQKEILGGRARTPCRSWPMEPHVRALGSVYDAALVNNGKSAAGLR